MRSKLGPLLILFATALWSTASLFHTADAYAVHPTFFILVEQLLGVLVLAPWIYVKRFKEVLSLKWFEWFLLLFIGICGSVFSHVFFQASFNYVDGTIPVFLQKLQPLLVIPLAFMFLGEKPQIGFSGWAFVAIASALVLSIHHFNFEILRQGLNPYSRGVIYALGSMSMSAIAIVFSKRVLKRKPPSVVAFWRYVFGLGTVAVLLVVSPITIPWEKLTQTHFVQSVAYLSLVPGILAALTYYAGLRLTSATLASFISLLLPVGVLGLHHFLFRTHLRTAEIIACASLVLAVAMIAYQRPPQVGHPK